MFSNLRLRFQLKLLLKYHKSGICKNESKQVMIQQLEDILNDGDDFPGPVSQLSINFQNHLPPTSFRTSERDHSSL